MKLITRPKHCFYFFILSFCFVIKNTKNSSFQGALLQVGRMYVSCRLEAIAGSAAGTKTHMQAMYRYIIFKFFGNYHFSILFLNQVSFLGAVSELISNMGLDGGTIPTRGELVQMKKKPEQVGSPQFTKGTMLSLCTIRVSLAASWRFGCRKQNGLSATYLFTLAHPLVHLMMLEPAPEYYILERAILCTVLCIPISAMSSILVHKQTRAYQSVAQFVKKWYKHQILRSKTNSFWIRCETLSFIPV